MTLRNSAALATLISISSVPTVAQNNAISWWAFDAGFEILASTTGQIKSAVGQAFVGPTRQSLNQIESGFLVDTLFRGPLVSIVEEPDLPQTYSLGQNYPNPFNPSTRIPFSLPKSERVTIEIYDLLGRLVARLLNEQKESGYYQVTWDAHGQASGVYLYRLQAGSFTQTRKFMLLR